MDHEWMIYLLGTSHHIQTEFQNAGANLAAKFERFKDCIENVILINNISAIAEELNQEIEIQRGRKSIARCLSEGMRPPIFYIPCEPSIKERAALGIPTDRDVVERTELTGDALGQYRDSELFQYFEPRENHWIECLRRTSARRVLFICGANHIQTFPSRLSENGMQYQIICANWWEFDERQNGALPLDERPI